MSEQTTFKQRILAAAEGMDNGDPLKDFLNDDEIEKAIRFLSEIYLISGEYLENTNPNPAVDKLNHFPQSTISALRA